MALVGTVLSNAEGRTSVEIALQCDLPLAAVEQVLKFFVSYSFVRVDNSRMTVDGALKRLPEL